VRISRPDKCVAKLGRGEVRRTPRTRIYLGGYYVGCPECGSIEVIQTRQWGGSVDFVEEIVDGAEVLTMTPAHECSRCAKRFEIHRDEVRLVA
jgi:DNA-directed RNA polymerase subunit RPC12/RpoP